MRIPICDAEPPKPGVLIFGSSAILDPAGQIAAPKHQRGVTVKRILSAIALAAMAVSCRAPKSPLPVAPIRRSRGSTTRPERRACRPAASANATLSTYRWRPDGDLPRLRSARHGHLYVQPRPAERCRTRRRSPNVTNIFGNVAAGLLNFTFADLFAGTTVGNGGSGGGAGMFNSYMVFGTGTGAAFTPYTGPVAVRPGPGLQ